jgi:hypothetical protein
VSRRILNPCRHRYQRSPDTNAILFIQIPVGSPRTRRALEGVGEEVWRQKLDEYGMVMPEEVETGGVGY